MRALHRRVFEQPAACSNRVFFNILIECFKTDACIAGVRLRLPIEVSVANVPPPLQK